MQEVGNKQQQQQQPSDRIPILKINLKMTGSGSENGKADGKKAKEQVKLKLFIKEQEHPQSTVLSASETKTIAVLEPEVSHETILETQTETTETEILLSPTISISSTTSTNNNNTRSYGTFIYRPFRLFPLLPPGSYYRVFIPSKYTNIKRNPAVSRNYLWKTEISDREGAAVLTDDSDIFCMFLDQYRNEYVNVQDQDLCIHVIVVDNPLVDVEKSEDEVSDPKSIYTTGLVTPRTWSGTHDGNYIRILKYSLGRKNIHLPKWRKRKASGSAAEVDGRQLTPNLKQKL